MINNTKTPVPSEALCRTRTGDPFLTIDRPLSGPVTTGHTQTPSGSERGGHDGAGGPPRTGQTPPERPHEDPIIALGKLTAIARGEWSDSDHKPEYDPPGSCDWDECDQVAAEWRWEEQMGGWLPVCSGHAALPSFTCAMCGKRFICARPDGEAVAEAEAVFSPEEIADAALVCDPCWHHARDMLPELDTLYREMGL